MADDLKVNRTLNLPNCTDTGSLQISPVQSHAQFNQERHFEPVHVFHVMADQRLHYFDFALRHLEDQFVVNLKRHAGFQIATADLLVNSNHRQLDQVGGGALQWSVDGGALGEAAQVGVAA